MKNLLLAHAAPAALQLALRASALVAVAASTAVAPAQAFAATAHSDLAQVAGDDKYDLKAEQVGECRINTECTARIVVTSKGEFHVNDSYPFKFTAAAPGLEFHGKGGNVFQAEDFEREKTRGTMLVRFKALAKGNVVITGKFKICICSDKICSPETIDVSIPVLVKEK
jgi:hypothetical protein